MRETLIDLFQRTNDLNISDIVTQIIISALLGLVIFVSYHISHIGAVYSKKFNVSLIALAVLTSTVMTVIGNNLALSLGMVGALSIVRFRTAIKDSRDTIYIFWSIVIGICCGTGDYVVAGIGSCVVFVIFLVLGQIQNDNRLLLVIKGNRENELQIESAVFQYYSGKAKMCVKNTTEKNIELIYEINRNLSKKLLKSRSITEVIYEIGNIEYVNLITQNDNISG